MNECFHSFPECRTKVLISRKKKVIKTWKLVTCKELSNYSKIMQGSSGQYIDICHSVSTDAIHMSKIISVIFITEFFELGPTNRTYTE